MKIAFEYFAEKANIINSQINELMDEINDFLNENENDIGDEDYIKELLDNLEIIDSDFLDIYNLEERYKQ